MDETTAVGLSPEDEQLWAFAQRIAPAKVLPEHLRGDPASVYFVLEMGKDWDMPRALSVAATFQRKDGTLGLHGAAMLALLYQRGFKVDFAFTKEPIGCTCTITRPNGGEYSRTFDMIEAGAIETFWDPDEKRYHRLADDPFYRSYPADCCQWRSLARCGRVAAPEILAGMYTPEELIGGPDENKPAKASGLSQTPAAAPIANEFVVGEKPEPPAAPVVEPESPTPETIPPTTETVAAPADTATPHVDPPPAPVETGSTPETPKAEPTFNDLIAIVDAKVGGDSKDSHKLIARYLKSFLKVERTPKDPAKNLPALLKLIPVLGQRIGDLRADPEGLGEVLSGRAKSALDIQFDTLGWARPLRAQALAVMEEVGQTPDQFVQWLNAPLMGQPEKGTGLSIAAMEQPALEILFPMFMLVKGSAFEIPEFAIARNQPVTATLQEVVRCAGKPLTEWDAEFTKGILEALKKVAAQEPEPVKNAPPADDDFMTAGLPFDQ